MLKCIHFFVIFKWSWKKIHYNNHTIQNEKTYEQYKDKDMKQSIPYCPPDTYMHAGKYVGSIHQICSGNF